MNGNKWLCGKKIYGKETYMIFESCLQLCKVYMEIAGQIRIIYIVN